MICAIELLDNNERHFLLQQAKSEGFQPPDAYQDTDIEQLQAETQACEDELHALTSKLAQATDYEQRFTLKQAIDDLRATIAANRELIADPIIQSDDEWLLQAYAESRIYSQRPIIDDEREDAAHDDGLEHPQDTERQIEQLRDDNLRSIVMSGQPISDYRVKRARLIAQQDAYEDFEEQHKLYSPPGILCELTQITMRSAPHPNLPLAFAGALSMMSFLIGRRVSFQFVAPNIYVVALARSGVGKQAPRETNMHVLRRLGLENHLVENIGSGQGLEDEMCARKEVLMQVDEIDSVIEAMGDSKNSVMRYFMGVLLKMFSASMSSYVGRTLAARKDMQELTPEKRVIESPSLTVLGCCLPSTLVAASSPAMFTNGLFSRMLFIEAAPRSEWQEKSKIDLSDDLINKLKTLLRIGLTGGNLDGVSAPSRFEIPATDEAKQALTHFQWEIDEHYRECEKRNDDFGAAVYSRAYEHCCKYCAIYACSESPANPIVTEQAVLWACHFAMTQSQRMLAIVAEHAVESPFDALCKKIMAKVQGSSNREISHSKLLKHSKVDSKTFAAAIETLIQRDELVRVSADSGTKPIIVYRSTGK